MRGVVVTGDKRLGVGLIGCGRAGLIHGRNFVGKVQGARLVALSDPNQEALAAASEELGVGDTSSDYTSMLHDSAIDAVIVVTPTVLHEEIVVAAAEAGKHVFCEKPMAMNLREAEAMNEAVRKNGTKLQIGFMRRFDREFAGAKQKVDDGAIGEVTLIKTLTHGPSTPKEWMYDIKKSNGPLAEVNSHDIDTVRWFAGSEVEEVYALAGNYRCRDVADQYPDFYDNVVLSIKLSDGKQAVVEGAVSVGYGYDARMEVLGTAGLLQAGRLETNTVRTVTSSGGVQFEAVPSWRNLFQEAYLLEDQAFVDAIRNDQEPPVTGFDGQMAVAVVLAGNESIRTGKPVRL
jgi:myo-inositol 2-dehydrogenase/D-chiro-inositol 1-dehydrogenase/scyllo-inositol 2-dehydrogenase (NAD+)